ncbi:hypothetical protein GOBAR_AA35425 [Gossypium barbadense]|uniref:Uncharacterized protein n=1 Tax=Gossypium barbadense TaxID=3634 RepID=A0A2P5W2F0_GOSBA|nr:hypothetical protein GOBAR_AA35425 [Gossypium barbadense]
MEVRLNDRGSSTTSLWLFNGPAPSATRLAIVAPLTAAAEARILQLNLRFMDYGQIIMMDPGHPVVLDLNLTSKRSTGHPYIVAARQLASVEKGYFGLTSGVKTHGTCSSPVFHDEYSYFLTALNVYFKYNVTKMLNEAGYVPSNSERYPLGGLVSAIENSFQATPEVICSKHDVKEIRLCFYKDFKPRNCLASKTSCPKYVSLPTYVALGRNESDMGIERISGDFEAL